MESINIIAYILSTVLLCTILLLNTVTILALRRTLVLPRNFKTLLLSLAVSDAGVGLLVQPLYIAVFAMLNTQASTSDVQKVRMAYFVIMNSLCVASFLGVAALAADRFLAIHLHIRYNALVTYKRVASGVTSIWVFSTSVSLLVLWKLPMTFAIIETILVICLLITGVFYVKIYLVVKHQANQIITLQTPRGEQNLEALALHARRQKKAATMTFGVYLVLAVCYLPNITIIAIKLISERGVIIPPIWLFASDMLVFLSSCLNPLIYCWKMKHVRHAAVDILRNIFLCLV